MSKPNSRRFMYQGNVPAEYLATNININYDPVTQRCVVTFNATGVTIINGTVIPLPATDVLVRDITHDTKLCLGRGDDKNTGADLSKISIEGIDRLIRCAFDYYHNLRQSEAEAAIENTVSPDSYPESDGSDSYTIPESSEYVPAPVSSEEESTSGAEETQEGEREEDTEKASTEDAGG